MGKNGTKISSKKEQTTRQTGLTTEVELQPLEGLPQSLQVLPPPYYTPTHDWAVSRN